MPDVGSIPVFQNCKLGTGQRHYNCMTVSGVPLWIPSMKSFLNARSIVTDAILILDPDDGEAASSARLCSAGGAAG